MQIFRKGGATYALCFPNGPTAVAVYLRAAWSLGATQQRYIFMGDGGDQFVGRVLAGLPFNSVNFGTLPPHFAPDVDLSGINVHVNDFDKLPGGFKSCLPFLVASLAYHKDWLQQNLPKAHPLRRSTIWTSGYLDEMKPLACLQSSAPILPTGVPPTILHAMRISNLEDRVEAIRSELVQHFANLANAVEKLPDQVASSILTRFDINGAVPVTESFVRSSIAEVENNLIGRLDALSNLLSTSIATVAVVGTTAAGSGLSAADPISSSFAAPRGGLASDYFAALRAGAHAANAPPPVPAGFHFPHKGVTVYDLWNLWLNGNKAENHGAYRLIDPSRDLASGGTQYYTRAKKVMSALINIAVEKGLILNEAQVAGVYTLQQQREVFAVAYKEILAAIHAEKSGRASAAGKKVRKFEDRRVGELSFVTLSDNLYKLSVNK